MISERKYITVTDWIVFFVSTLLIFLSSILLLISGLMVLFFRLFKRKPILAFSILVLLTILIIVVHWCFDPIPWNAKENSAHVIIERGDSMAKIVGRLQEIDLIEDGKWFLILGKLLGKDRQIQAGRYDFRKGTTLYSIFNKLVKGDVTSIQVIIPEGLTLREIALILSEKIGVDSEEFVKIAMDSGVTKNLDIPASNLEGYLFPDTYRLHWGMHPTKLVQTMVNEFKKIFNVPLLERSKEIDFSVHEAVTLASMIEAETRDGEEREMISAVYHNRLRLGMLLQCDPTVVYALGAEQTRFGDIFEEPEGETDASDFRSSTSPLLLRDLEIDSPYNTYKYLGLPPGPICNPGKASILAALYPADVDYLYFVARGDGTHVFSRTLAEHNQAKNEAKRARSGKQ